MGLTKQEFKAFFKKKFKDMGDVLFNNFGSGILNNDIKTSFTEEETDGLIKLYTHSYGEGNDLPKFKEVYQEKVDILTKQIFYAIDKGIEGNKLKIDISEGNINCYFTVKTAPHKEQGLFFLENDNNEKKENDDAKGMTI